MSKSSGWSHFNRGFKIALSTLLVITAPAVSHAQDGEGSWFEDMFSESPKPKPKAKKQDPKQKPAAKREEVATGSAQGTKRDDSAEAEAREAFEKLKRPKHKQEKPTTPEEERALEAKLNNSIKSYADKKSKATTAAEELASSKKDYLRKKDLSDAAISLAQNTAQAEKSAVKKLETARARLQNAIANEADLAKDKAQAAAALERATALRVDGEKAHVNVVAQKPAAPALPDVPAMPIEAKPIQNSVPGLGQALAPNAPKVELKPGTPPVVPNLTEEQKAQAAAEAAKKAEEQARIDAENKAAREAYDAAVKARQLVLEQRKALENAHKQDLARYEAAVKGSAGKVEHLKGEEAKALKASQKADQAHKTALQEIENGKKSVSDSEGALAKARELAAAALADSEHKTKSTQEADELLRRRTAASKAATTAKEEAYAGLNEVRDDVRAHNKQKALGVANRMVDLTLEIESARSEAHYKKKSLASAQADKAAADKDLAQKEKELGTANGRVANLGAQLTKTQADLGKRTAELKAAQEALAQAEGEYREAYERFKKLEAQAGKAQTQAENAVDARKALDAKIKAKGETIAALKKKLEALAKDIAKLEGDLAVAKTAKAELEAKIAAANTPAPVAPATGAPNAAKPNQAKPNAPAPAPVPAVPAPKPVDTSKLKAALAELDKKITTLEKTLDEKNKTKLVDTASAEREQASLAELVGGRAALVAAEQAAQDTAAREAKVAAEAKAVGAAKLAVQTKAKDVREKAKSSHSSTVNAEAGLQKDLKKAQQEQAASTEAVRKAQDRAKARNGDLDQATKRNASAQARLDAAHGAEKSYMDLVKREEGRYEIRPEDAEKHSKEMLLYYRSSVWPRSAANDYWTDLVVAEIRNNWDELNQARDIGKFCPGYRDASRQLQTVCWLRIIGGVVKFESNFKTNDTFFEKDFGYDSVGLFSLSRGECKQAPTDQLLGNPVLNLSCGVRIMARYIAKDDCIAGPEPKSCGASKYWAVLNLPYQAGGLDLGHQEYIIKISTKYKDFQ